MTIKQISVFIENKSGTVTQVLNLLGNAGIHLIASTIADTVDYGIFRLICGNSLKAYKLLRQAGLSVALSDVFALLLENRTGAAARAIDKLAAQGLNLTYFYSFPLAGKGVVVFRTDNYEKTREVIVLDKLTSITEEDLTLLANQS